MQPSATSDPSVALSDTLCTMSKVFRSRPFSRWMRRAGLTDEALLRAVSEMEQGLVDADLGGGVFKKRVALPGRGKRAGARTIVATRMKERWFFLYGFEKNERANISSAELKALQEYAKDLLGLDAAQLAAVVSTGEMTEVAP